MSLMVNSIGSNPSYEREARRVNFFVNPGSIPPLTGTGSSEGSVTSGRAIDKAPRAQMFAYNEYLAPQGGYEEGVSTKSLIA